MNFRTIISLVCILILLVGMDYLEAWTTPTVAAPGGNVAAPLNTGSAAQVKTGALSTGALAVTGDARVTSAAPLLWFTDDNERDYRVKADANNLTIHGDRDGNNSWTAADDPATLTIRTGTTTFADYAQFASQVRATAYCDLNGENCLNPNSAGNTSSGGGNEIVWLNSPQQIYTSNDFRSNSEVSKTIFYSDHGLPANLVRVLLTANLQSAKYAWGTISCSSDGYNCSYGWIGPGSSASYVLPGLSNRRSLGQSVGPNCANNNNNCGVANPAPALTFGEWIEPRNNQQTVIIKCTSDCGDLNKPQASVYVSAYECQGPCTMDGGISQKTCQVTFDSTVHGHNETNVRTVPGNTTMAIGVWSDDDDRLTLPYSEELDYQQWGASAFDKSEKAGVGYFDEATYNGNSTALIAADGSNRYRIQTLSLTNGTTLEITSEYVSSSVPAGEARLRATVSNCSS